MTVRDYEVHLATPANMERARVAADEPVAAPGVFAYSPLTGERFSASPGDYFAQPADEPLLDEEGEPMILATSAVRVYPIQLS